MKLQLVEEHTIALLPKSNSYILDVGCRHFDFALAMHNNGYKVCCIDADKEVDPMKFIDRVKFTHAALVPESENLQMNEIISFGNGTANHLASVGGSKPKNAKIWKIIGRSITNLSSIFEVSHWDVIKLDCEGAEYNVLSEWPGPISDQITVEFHEHTGANNTGEQIYKQILNHLSQWYTCVQHEKSISHCLSTPNYWDSLFVLNKLMN